MPEPITLTADINAGKMNLALADVTIGIIGDAVGGWDNDTKMVYNFSRTIPGILPKRLLPEVSNSVRTTVGLQLTLLTILPVMI